MNLAARLAQPFVVRTALMPRVLGQVDPANARIADRRHDLFRIIRASIADDEHLEIAHRLPQHAADRVGSTLLQLYVAMMTETRGDIAANCVTPIPETGKNSHRIVQPGRGVLDGRTIASHSCPRDFPL